MSDASRPWKSKAMAVTVAATALLALQVAGANPAFAYTYDGVYPVNSGCDNSSVFTARSASVRNPQGSTVGKVELRYSLTCHAAWVRFTNYYTYVPYDAHKGYGTVKRNSDGRSYTCSPPAGKNQFCVTRMVYDKDPLTSYGYAHIDDYPNSYADDYARTSSY